MKLEGGSRHGDPEGHACRCLRLRHGALDGFTHISIRVTELNEVVERLRALRVQVLDRTRIDIATRGSAAVMTTDPDDLWIELVDSPSNPALPQE